MSNNEYPYLIAAIVEFKNLILSSISITHIIYQLSDTKLNENKSHNTTYISFI